MNFMGGTSYSRSYLRFTNGTKEYILKAGLWYCYLPPNVPRCIKCVPRLKAQKNPSHSAVLSSRYLLPKSTRNRLAYQTNIVSLLEPRTASKGSSKRKTSTVSFIPPIINTLLPPTTDVYQSHHSFEMKLFPLVGPENVSNLFTKKMKLVGMSKHHHCRP